MRRGRERQTHRLLCIALIMCVIFIAFRVRHRWGEMYIGHGRLCVSLCHLVMHYWADLQSVHGFRCYDNIALNAKCQWVLAVALCVVDKVLRLACDNEGSHSFAWHVYPHIMESHPAFTPQLQCIAGLWLLLISHPTESRRLSWTEWLSEIQRWFACTKTVTHWILAIYHATEILLSLGKLEQMRSRLEICYIYEPVPV